MRLGTIASALYNGEVLVSDSFSHADAANIVGLSTDSAYGGTAKTWASGVGTGTWGITSGKLIRSGTNLKLIGFDAGFGDIEMSMVFSQLPDTQTNCTIRHSDITSATPSSYNFSISAAGVLTLNKTITGTVTTLATGGTISAGDRIGIRALGSNITASVNNVVTLSATNAEIANTNTSIGIVSLAGTTGLKIDDLIIRKAVG